MDRTRRENDFTCGFDTDICACLVFMVCHSSRSIQVRGAAKPGNNMGTGPDKLQAPSSNPKTFGARTMVVGSFGTGIPRLSHGRYLSRGMRRTPSQEGNITHAGRQDVARIAQFALERGRHAHSPFDDKCPTRCSTVGLLGEEDSRRPKALASTAHCDSLGACRSSSQSLTSIVVTPSFSANLLWGSPALSRANWI